MITKWKRIVFCEIYRRLTADL